MGQHGEAEHDGLRRGMGGGARRWPLEGRRERAGGQIERRIASARNRAGRPTDGSPPPPAAACVFDGSRRRIHRPSSTSTPGANPSTPGAPRPDPGPLVISRTAGVVPTASPRRSLDPPPPAPAARRTGAPQARPDLQRPRVPFCDASARSRARDSVFPPNLASKRQDKLPQGTRCS
uniref:Uncharacterized protein n=1 Tax=Setaria viridis TaxID=4556 RepID=A0A4U6UEF0_SETVI|nr:hypothetical protein SEVIR_5G114100v2 [Setaria viridis]